MEKNEITETNNVKDGSKDEIPIMDTTPIQPLHLFYQNNSNENNFKERVMDNDIVSEKEDKSIFKNNWVNEEVLWD